MSNNCICHLNNKEHKERKQVNFINNPFDLLLEIMAENHPEIECDVYVSQQMTDGKETFGCTVFPEDEADRVII